MAVCKVHDFFGNSMTVVRVIVIYRKRLMMSKKHDVVYSSSKFFDEVRRRNKAEFVSEMAVCLTKPNPPYEEVEKAYKNSNMIYDYLMQQGLLDVYGRAKIVIGIDNK